MHPDDRPVLHVVQHLRPGGLEVLALELARAQSASRPAAVVSLEGDEDEAVAAWPRLAGIRGSLHFLGKRPGLDPLLVPRLAALFRRARPVCVQTHHAGPLIYAGAAARLALVPRLLHVEHDAWHLRDPRRRRTVAGLLSVLRPLVVADADHVADAFARELALPRPRVIPNGVDADRFAPGDRAAARAALGLPDGPLVGMAARLERVKGADLALRAVSLVPGATLAIAGTGGERGALEALAAELGLGDRVRFLGHLDDTAPFHRALDAYCLPSRDEGLPLAILEAQACGAPVAAFGVGGVPAAVDPASGEVVAAGDVEGLAAALRRILEAPRGDPRAFVLARGSLRDAAAAYLALATGKDAP